MPTKGKTPPPVPGENGASRKKKLCANPTGGSGLADQRPAWEQLKSLGLIPLDEQYDCMKAVSSFYTNKLKSLNPKANGSVVQLHPSPAQPQAQVHAAPDFQICHKCFAVSASDAPKCRECGHQFQPERRELQHVEKSQLQQPVPARGHNKPLRLEHHEILRFLPDRLGGQPRLNIRTREVHLPDRVISSDEANLLYLELSSEVEKWPKEATYDAVQHLAATARFDPVLEELERITANTDPLPMEEWDRLDQLLFNIDDPIAAAFLPRFLIAAVARVLQPGCKVDQTPVLIGPQGIGKTQTGRVLFGAPFFGDGLTHRFDVDDITRLQRVWALELSEVDGITRRSDQEALKAFLTRQVDIDRRKYGKEHEGMPRRSVFWGTSNGAPLRDLSGSRRFVCIALPNRGLPLEAIASLRPAIWARALEQYRAGMPWHSTGEESAAITERNADHQQLDPWAEYLADYLERRKAAVPIKVADLLTFLEVPKERQTRAIYDRLRQVMEAIGWEQRRPQINGQRVQGFYPRP